MFSIPAVKGVEFGSGFGCIAMKGSEHNDAFVMDGKKVVTKTNNAGGILGGISNGMPIVFRVAIKPTSSISKPQRTVNLKELKECEIRVGGRHDPCIAIRVAPVVESMAAICMLDLILRDRAKDVSGLRNGIEDIDTKILDLLSERMEVAKLIAEEKRKEGKSVLDAEREKKLEGLWMGKAKMLNLDVEEIRKILKIILRMSKKKQIEVKSS